MTDINKLKKTAEAAFDNKKFGEAVWSYQEIVKASNFSKLETHERAEIWLNYALSCVNYSNIPNLEMKIKINYLTQAQNNYEKFLEVSSSAEQVAKVNFHLIQLFTVRGWCHFDAHQSENALADFRHAKRGLAKQNPAQHPVEYKEHAWALLDLERNLLSYFGDDALDSHDPKKAVTYYLDAVKVLELIIAQDNPQHVEDKMSLQADTLHNLGDCYAALNDKSQSLIYFTLSLGLYSKLSALAGDKKDEAKAEKYLKYVQSVEAIISNLDAYIIKQMHDVQTKVQRKAPKKAQAFHSARLKTVFHFFPASDAESDVNLTTTANPGSKSREELESMSIQALTIYLQELKNITQEKTQQLTTLQKILLQQ